MLIDEAELEKRLNNPLNLLNRMRVGLVAPEKKSGMDLFIKKESIPNDTTIVKIDKAPRAIIPLPPSANEVPSSDDLIKDADAQIKLSIAHDNALDLLTSSINMLKSKVENNDIKTSSIPSVMASASKVVSEIRKERLEREKNNKNENVHYHFYCPTQRKIDEYEIIEVAG